jgi:hypothetical protein
MGRTLDEMVGALPEEEQAAVKQRAEALIAEELSLGVKPSTPRRKAKGAVRRRTAG